MAEADTRRALLDAAIHVIGRGGVQALTLRAVEEHASASHGTARYWFKTKDGLVEQTLDRLAELDLDAVEQLRAAVLPTDPDEIASMIATAARSWLSDGRDRLIARYELFLEAGRRPALAARISESGEVFRTLAERVLSALAAPDPIGSARLFSALLDGLVLDQVARSETAVDLETGIARLLRAFI